MAIRSKQPKAKRIKWQRFGLLFFCSLFAASGLLRMGLVDIAQASISDLASQPDLPHSTVGGQCAPIQSLEHALELVAGRAEVLDEREARLDDWQVELDSAEGRLRAQLAALEVIEDRLQGLLALSDTAAEDDLARLTQVYESMDPGDAATLFAEMDPSFAAGFLGRMQADSAAGILSSLDPVAAYSISVILATRNAGPTQDRQTQN